MKNQQTVPYLFISTTSPIAKKLFMLIPMHQKIQKSFSIPLHEKSTKDMFHQLTPNQG